MTSTDEDRSIVITGAAGFIGSCVVAYLNQIGKRNLILVDDLDTTEKWKNLRGKSMRDFVPKDQIFDWIKGKEKQIKAWIHLGACSDTTELDGAFLMENNYRYSIRIAEIALLHGHRLIYASSAATYGKGENGFSDAHEKLSLLVPLNLYGFSKHLFDLWLYERGLLNKVVGLKYFNIFGPNEGHKGHMASVVFKMVPTILQEGVVRLFKSTQPHLFGDGEQKRDFLYVKDAVRLTCSFLYHDQCGIFNVGSGIATSWNRLVSAMFKSLAIPEKIEYIPMDSKLEGKYQNYTCADMAKWEKLCGVKLEYSLEEAVDDYIRNYLLQEKRW